MVGKLFGRGKKDEKPELPVVPNTPKIQPPVDESIIPPGFRLLHLLRGHSLNINQIAWSQAGSMLASPSEDNRIGIWNTQTGKLLRMLEGHSDAVNSMAWSPDDRKIISGSNDHTARIWNTEDGTQILSFKMENLCNGVAWSPDAHTVAASCFLDTIHIIDANDGIIKHKFSSNSDMIVRVVWDSKEDVLASCSMADEICLWSGKTFQLLRRLKGGSGITWSPDSRILVSGSRDSSVRIWNAHTGQLINSLEGHTDQVYSTDFSSDGSLLASKSLDSTVRIWRTDTWETIAVLNEVVIGNNFGGLAFHPTKPNILATLGAGEHGPDTVIRIWELDYDEILRHAPKRKSVFYTTAKIALVGDSGVGKSGLGYRLAEKRWQITESTHGQQFWVVDELGQTRADGTQCEAVLWDFAGQPNYRPLHALFLDEVDLALLLFDPSRQDTLSGVDYWLKQLAFKKDQLCKTVLVAARTDVSKLQVSQAELDAFCRERGITGGFIATSAKKDVGIAELLDLIRREIDWDAKPATVSPETFKRVKDYVLKLKAEADRANILVSPAELRARLQAEDPDWQFTDAEMMTAVGHLENHGFVTLLRRSAEEDSILLAPDVLINLAASIMRQAETNEKGLGALDEARARHNDYRFPEVEKLSEAERDALLNAAIELFIERNVCFRESVDNQTFLIFPSLILERPPQLAKESQIVEDWSYVVAGAVENVYPALVVLLGYSPFLRRTNQWRRQAEYGTTKGDICGFRQVSDTPGELELVLYYGQDAPEYTQQRFQGLFEEILWARDLTIEKFPPVVCPHCGFRQERSTVIRRTRQGRGFLNCEDCGKRINLPKTAERITVSRPQQVEIARDRAYAALRTSYELALASVKGFIHERGDETTPSCFVSYAWGNKDHERWVEGFADDLSNAGLRVFIDRKDAPPGTDITRFMSDIEDGQKVNFVLPVGTPLYRVKYENENPDTGSAVAFEMQVINVRMMRGTQTERDSILPLLLAGSDRESLPPSLRHLIFSDFRSEDTYFITLFELVLTLYGIEFDHAAVRDLRARLRREADDFSQGYRLR